jgi:hypothetical protein
MRPRADLAVASVFGAAAFLAVAAGVRPHGPGLTADSAVYLSVAESLREGRGFVFFTGAPYVTGPPLYPFLLAATPGALSGLRLGAGLLGAAAFAAFVLLAARNWAATGLPARLRLFGLAALCAAAPLVAVFQHVWSEVPFLVLSAAFLLAASRFAETGSSRALAGMTAASLLACLTRYIGVAFVAAGVSVILLRRDDRPARRLGRAFALGAASCAPLALWLARNAAVSESPAGERAASIFTAGERVSQILDTLAVWAGARHLPPPARLGILAVIAAGMVLGLGRRPEIAPAARASAVFAGAYAAALLTASSVGFDRLDDRLLSPLYLPLTTLALHALEGWLGVAALGGGAPGAVSASRLARAALAAAAALWVLGSAARTYRFERTARADGPGGFASPAWRSSELAARIRELPADAVLVSNEPAVAYLLAGRPAHQSPRRTLYHTTTPAEGDLPALDALVRANGRVFLAWFDRIDAQHLWSVEDLRARYEVTTLTRIGDGRFSTLELPRAAAPPPR